MRITNVYIAILLLQELASTTCEILGICMRFFKYKNYCTLYPLPGNYNVISFVIIDYSYNKTSHKYSGTRQLSGIY